MIGTAWSTLLGSSPFRTIGQMFGMKVSGSNQSWKISGSKSYIEAGKRARRVCFYEESRPDWSLHDSWISKRLAAAY
jgi:hypothetical protein